MNYYEDENKAAMGETASAVSDTASHTEETQAPKKPQSKTVSYGGFKNKWSYEEYEKTRSAKRSGKSHRGLRIFAAVMSVVSVISLTSLGVVLAGGFTLAGGGEQAKTDELPSISIPSQTDREPDMARQDIIKKAKPGVVGILGDIIKNEVLVAQTVGSGFIITSDGYIVTNFHVVDGVSSVTVVLLDGTEYKATIKGTDELTDVAVLKIEATDLPAVEIGNSDIIEEGDSVIAIGTPSGIEYAGTSTHGMVSAINRDMKIMDDDGVHKKTMTVIQIDAPINKGNSGGPVINGQGQVIGVATLKLGNGYEGMGFALPINGVIPIVNELIKNGEVVDRPEDGFVHGRPYIGVRIEDISAQDAEDFGLPLGVYVRFVEEGSAAKEAGIEMGDIITKFNGVDVTSTTDLTKAVSTTKPGDTVEVIVFREALRGSNENSGYITLSVTVGSAS